MPSTRFSIGLPLVIAVVAGSLAGCATRHHTKPGAQATGETSPTVSPAGGSAFDPFAVALSGDDLGTLSSNRASHEKITLGPKPAAPYRPSNAAHGFLGEVVGGSGAAFNGLDPSRAGGENLTQVSFSIEGADFDPCISPDGTQIVFASTQHRATADLYIKGVDSRVVSQLTNDPAHDVMPSVSPDGTRIAFASNRNGNWDLFVMPTSGGAAVHITTETSHELHPSWSPDGRYLTFCRLGEVSGKWEIWVTEVNNSGVAQFLTYGLFPTWCPVSGTGVASADRILFQRSRQRGDRSFGIWTIDYKAGQANNPTEIVANASAACINPTWSPDGRWVAFATVPNPAQWSGETTARPTSAELWMVGNNGEGLVRLTSGKSVNLMPTWSSQNRLYFISDRGGVDNIWGTSMDAPILAATGNTSPTSGTTTAQGHSAGAQDGHTAASNSNHASTPANGAHALVDEDH